MDTFGQLMGGLGLTAVIFAYVARTMVELSYRTTLGRTRDTIQRLTTERMDQTTELERASREVLAKREELRKLEKTAAQRSRELAELRTQSECLVHLVGDKAPGAKLFSCELTFSRSRGSKALRGILSHPSVWSYPNIVEAWAENEGEAVRLLDATFPKSAGFRLSRFQEVPGG